MNPDNQTFETPAPTPGPLSRLPMKQFFESDHIKAKFRELLGSKAQGFITSVLQVVAGNTDLSKADPQSVYNAAATAATMDLPINQNLGFAWIVPYSGKAQFQMGYKGFIQLGLRTGQYLRINAIPVYPNQFKGWNALTEDLEADFSIDGEGEPVGYCAYFKLVNGFEKTVYWSVGKVTKHAQKYSKSYSNPKGQWKNDFESMALKTVLKSILSKWGILSIEMQKALSVDQAILKNDEGTDVEYPDNSDEMTSEERSAAATNATSDAIKNASNKARNGEK